MSNPFWKKITKINVGFAVAICLSGCVHYIPAAISSTSLGQNEKVVGVASGTGESLKDAVTNAIGTSGADTIVNVFADAEWLCFLGCRPTGMTRVYGTLIKYVDNQGKNSLMTVRETINELKSGEKIIFETKDGLVRDGTFETASENNFYYQSDKSNGSIQVIHSDDLKSIKKTDAKGR